MSLLPVSSILDVSGQVGSHNGTWTDMVHADGTPQVVDQAGKSFRSLAFQVQEVGKAGPLRFRVAVSIDGVNWYVIAGETPVGGTEPEPFDVNPGGLQYFFLTQNFENGTDLAWRFFKVQVQAPSVNPNQAGVGFVTIFGR